MIRKNYFILTGAPGSGKTSIIEELRKKNIFCVDEPAREILAEQRLIKGSGLPEINPQLFSDLLLSRSIMLYKSFLHKKEIVVFDRGVSDNYAYAKLFSLDTTSYENAAYQYQSNKFIFMLSPWKEIYKTDDERKMSFEESMLFHHYFKEIYKKTNCKIIEVPKISLNKRVDFIVKRLLE